MADVTLVVVPVKFLCGQRPDGTWMGEGRVPCRSRNAAS